MNKIIDFLIIGACFILFINCASRLNTIYFPPQETTYSYIADTVSVVSSRWEELDTLKALPVQSVEKLIEYYKPVFKYMQYKTQLPESFFYSYFRCETTARINGKWTLAGSSLWLNGFNPGGIKYRSALHSHYQYGNDDCDNPNTIAIEYCRFAKFNTMREGLDAWVDVINADRYAECPEKTLSGIFICFKNNRYHSSKRWKHRYFMAVEYEQQLYN